MKKLSFVFAIMIAMFFVVQKSNAQSTASATFNLSMTVDKYIETTPQPITFDYGTTYHANNAESLDGGGVAGINWNLAYANCPFSITLSGNNPANEGKPRFARAQTGNNAAGVFDVLNTLYQIHVVTNNVVTGINGDGNWGIAAQEFPFTESLLEAPHNGQVLLNMYPYVNYAGNAVRDATPVRETLINPGFTDQQSADAGSYTCTMLITLAAL